MFSLLLATAPTTTTAKDPPLGPNEEIVVEGPGYRVQFDLATTAGNTSFVVLVKEKWAPYASARFLDLVRAGFYDDQRLLIVLPDKVVQFGISGDPAKQAARMLERIKPEMDEEARRPNTAGTVAFLPMSDGKYKTQKNSVKEANVQSIQGGTGSTQIVIHMADLSEFDAKSVRPFGELERGGLAALRTAHAHKGIPI